MMTVRELEQRAINKLTPKARRIAGMILVLDKATRMEVLKAFDGRSGAVKIDSE